MDITEDMSPLFDEATTFMEIMEVVVKKVRPKIMKMLQEMRDKGEIGNSLDAEIILPLHGDAFVKVSRVGGHKMLTELFKVSNVLLVPADLQITIS